MLWMEEGKKKSGQNGLGTLFSPQDITIIFPSPSMQKLQPSCVPHSAQESLVEWP